MSGTEELISVIKSKNIGKLSELLKKMALDEINRQVENGNTPLHMAIFYDNAHAVSKILAHPEVDVNVQNDRGSTPLHHALWCGSNAQIVSELLASPNVDVNVQDVHGNTPLLLACDYYYQRKEPGLFQIVKKLLASPGVDVNVGRRGITALMWAARRCEKKVLRLLLNDPRVNLDAKDDYGRGVEEQLGCDIGNNKEASEIKRNCLDMLNNERKKRENRELNNERKKRENRKLKNDRKKEENSKLKQEQPSQKDSNIGKGIEKIEKLNREMEDLKKKWKENLDSRKQKKRDLNERHSSENKILFKKYKEDEAALKKKHEKEKTVLENTFAREDEMEQRHFAILRERRDELVQELQKLNIHPAQDYSEDRNKVEAAKSSLECPVCFELMRPPTRIWMCQLSHIICEPCKDELDKKKENRGICPTCMTERVNMRAWLAENFARTIFKECCECCELKSDAFLPFHRCK